jgi:hypothetical protein
MNDAKRLNQKGDWSTAERSMAHANDYAKVNANGERQHTRGHVRSTRRHWDDERDVIAFAKFLQLLFRFRFQLSTGLQD